MATMKSRCLHPSSLLVIAALVCCAVGTVVWPDDVAAKCSQTTKLKAMYGLMTWSESFKAKPFESMEVVVQWNDWRHNPISNPKKRGGNYIAYTTATVDGPGGYFGAQITHKRGGGSNGQFLFSFWDIRTYHYVNNKKVRRPARRLTWPIMMSRCKRNCQDCRGVVTTGTQCKLPYPDLKVGHKYKILLKQLKKKMTINTADYGGFPEAHAAIGEVNRQVTGGLWEVKVEDIAENKVMSVGQMLMEGPGEGMSQLGTFDEMIGCNKCNSNQHKNTRFDLKVGNKDGTVRVPLTMGGNTKWDQSTCKKYMITGSKKERSISFESGPFTVGTFKKGTLW